MPSRSSEPSSALRAFSGEPSSTRFVGFSSVRREADAELGRDDEFVATAGDRLADELLVRVRAVHLGGVEEVAAQLERAVDRRERLALVGGPVESGHAHAAEPDRGNVERSEVASSHGSASLSE